MTNRFPLPYVLVLGLFLGTTYSTPAKAQAPTFLAQWGLCGSGSGQFSGPYGVAVSAAGQVYVCDQFNHRVQYFSAGGAFLGAFGSFGTGPGQFRVPYNIAVGPDGSVYVSERDAFVDARVQKFSSNGTFIREWRGAASPGGAFSGNILGLAVEPNGDVLISDGGTSRICRYSPDGVFLAQLTGIASYSTIAANSVGEFYVADITDIVKYSSTGQQIARSSLPEGSNVPSGLTVDSYGNIFVVDHLANHVLKLSPAGQLIAEWGTFGGDPGHFDTPCAVSVDQLGHVYVSDLGNCRIQVFGDVQTAAANSTWGRVKDRYRK